MIGETDPILIVDDSAQDAALFSVALEGAEIKNPLVFTTSYDDTVDYYAGAGKYADRKIYPIARLIFLDIRMPRLSGFELLAWLRANQTSKDSRIIMMSGAASPFELERVFAIGADSFLKKPLSTIELIESLKRVRASWLLNAS
jgi:CheY-like chemotaxis protein